MEAIKLERDANASSSNFKAVADPVFQTLLTVTTILSGVYVSITFGWFSQAMLEPHPGGPPTPEMMIQATIGIFLGLIFIVPLISVLMAWALSKFNNSTTWRTASWSGLLYCLSQDFVGVVALISIPMWTGGGPADVLLFITGATVILPPPIFAAVFGYKIGIKYDHASVTADRRKKKHVTPSLSAAVFLLAIQIFLGLLMLYFLGTF